MTGFRNEMNHLPERGDRWNRYGERAQLPASEVMKYIVEILSEDVVWLINEHRRLISLHTSTKEATYYCQKHFQEMPVVVDRRPEFANAPVH